MAKGNQSIKKIWVYADWSGMEKAELMGVLQAEQLRGKEIFSFSYDSSWLEKKSSLLLDPALGFFSGPQYNSEEKPNFGLFTDSSPDRWGRTLMQRREALIARSEKRKSKTLMESDYLLGVFDQYRMGALRFKIYPAGDFLDADNAMPAPPFTSIRTLEEASLQLENEDAFDNKEFAKWLSILISLGASLGGARPKASVVDPKGDLWIAKFPSRNDTWDTGGWEAVVNVLAQKAGVHIAEGNARRFTQSYHTFLTKRFDRIAGQRIHFASAMTLLGKTDGADAAAGSSYLDIAEFIMRHGASPDKDLPELWRRIVFNICVSNSDDHLRNHGFLLSPKGWLLSPAFDVNPIPNSTGLNINISEHSNALDLELAREVAEKFRVQQKEENEIIEQVTKAISYWHEVAGKSGIARSEMQQMESAFTL